jgi:hypothetical protein
MGVSLEQRARLAAKFEAILPHLDERQRRLLIGAEAWSIGHGGIRLVARAAGVREATVSAGVKELESGQAPLGRVRRPGGDRKRIVDLNPAVREALQLSCSGRAVDASGDRTFLIHAPGNSDECTIMVPVAGG